MKKIIILVLLLITCTYTQAQIPTRNWGTYFGGSGGEDAYCTIVDGSGNVYVAGNTTSASGIATTGAYQTTYGSGTFGDNFLAKFSSTGALLWATYFGGSGNEQEASVAVDASGDVYLFGRTTSTTGIATAGAYQTTLAGSYDLFLAKFTSSGSILWATYYGGSGNEISGSICIDGSGNVYIGATTQSTTGIASTGAYQTVIGGTQDGALIKFSSSGARVWGTYHGGAGDETGFVSVDGSGNVFLAGRTASTSGIATTGVHQTVYGGGVSDAYLAKFSSTCSRLWATYYGGSGDDDARGVSVDGTGNAYLTGNTTSTAAIATTGAHQTTFGGGTSDAYLAKFNSLGSLLWGTYYGGSSGTTDEWGNATVINSSGDIYMVGRTTSTSAIATSGSFQNIHGGGGLDGFLVKFNSAGVRQWGTYYGGSGSESNRGLSIGGASHIYINGGTSSTSGIATSGAYGSTLSGTGDAFLVDFTDAAGLPAITGTTTLCVSSTSTLSNATPGGTWSSSTIGIATVGSASGVVFGVAAGTATITYTVGAGYVTTTVTVVAPPTAAISGAASVCVTLTVTLTPTPSGGVWSSVFPSIATVGSSTGIVTGVATGLDTIKYTVTNACGTAVATHTVNVISGGSCTAKIKKGRKEPFTAEETQDLLIYPNPAYNEVIIENAGSYSMFTILNSMGRQLLQQAVNEDKTTIAIQMLPPGLYYIMLKGESGNEVQKFVKM